VISREQPIVCTLEGAALPSRLDEWRALLQFVTERTEIPGGMRVTFGADTSVGEIARLAAAEQQCCGFFSFAITLDARGVALEVTAPADARPVLEGLFGAEALRR
jgi:MerR family transcriptional regulator, copper efflux regulator